MLPSRRENHLWMVRVVVVSGGFGCLGHLAHNATRIELYSSTIKSRHNGRQCFWESLHQHRILPTGALIKPVSMASNIFEKCSTVFFFWSTGAWMNRVRIASTGKRPATLHRGSSARDGLFTTRGRGTLESPMGRRRLIRRWGKSPRLSCVPDVCEGHLCAILGRYVASRFDGFTREMRRQKTISILLAYQEYTLTYRIYVDPVGAWNEQVETKPDYNVSRYFVQAVWPK